MAVLQYKFQYPIYPTHAQSFCKHERLFTDTVPCTQDPAHIVAAFCWDCHMTFSEGELNDTKPD